MAVVVEPTLTEQKLRSLLAEGHEQTCLDYKSKLDLSERSDIIELAKDVAAMQGEPSGGYIVVGADDQGKPTPNLTPVLAKLFDEATVRPKLEKYLNQPFTVRSALHNIDSILVVLIFVGPGSHGWCIFRTDGEYEDCNSKKKVVFRVGDVFVRHGTSSERWNDTDRERLVRQIIASQKEAWRIELRQELAAVIDTNLSARRLEELPSSAVTWKLDSEGFDQLVTELFRRNDDIPLRQLLMKAPVDAVALLDNNPDELATLLDRLTSLSALALQFERRTWLERSLASLVAIYDLGFDSSTGFERDQPIVVQLWLNIASRVSAIGGLAVRREDWNSVRILADRRPHGESFRHRGSWLRHAVTMASRANILETEQLVGLIARAHNVIRVIEATHPDKTVDDEAILNSLCQFDALAGLVVIGERGSFKSGNFYPSFSRYPTRRTEPAYRRIVTDRAMRKKLFDGDDQFLADAILETDRLAQQEGLRYIGWDGVEDDEVKRFVAAHKT
ncbi:MAG: ATP-binding protein [Pseudonocardiaceae bacterium]